MTDIDKKKEELVLSDYVLKIKNAEAKQRKAFDGFSDKIAKAIDEYKKAKYEEHLALAEAEEFLQKERKTRRNKEFVDLYNQTKSTIKPKIDQREFIRLKGNISDLRRIIGR